MKKGSYAALIDNLVARFPDDPVLQHDLRRVERLDAIIEALALSYAGLIELAMGERYGASVDDGLVDQALSNAQVREAAIAEIMAFFERTHVETPQVQVWCAGSNAVRVRRSEPPIPARA